MTGTNYPVIIYCEQCGKRPRNAEEVEQLNAFGICKACITEDHVRGDLINDEHIQEEN